MYYTYSSVLIYSVYFNQCEHDITFIYTYNNAILFSSISLDIRRLSFQNKLLLSQHAKMIDYP